MLRTQTCRAILYRTSVQPSLQFHTSWTEDFSIVHPLWLSWKPSHSSIYLQNSTWIIILFSHSFRKFSKFLQNFLYLMIPCLMAQSEFYSTFDFESIDSQYPNTSVLRSCSWMLNERGVPLGSETIYFDNMTEIMGINLQKTIS